MGRNILAISGSASEKNASYTFLKVIAEEFKSKYEINPYNKIRDFPLFTPEKLEAGPPELIRNFKNKLENADAVVISTPEYSHNIPACLKNALEWITASGELADKKILPITLTPNAPRGEYAMESLLFTLKTLKANIVTQLPLYKDEVVFEGYDLNLNDETKLITSEALKLLF